MSNLSKKRFTSFTEDEELAEQVKRFPCVYNKSAKSYKEKHVVRNTWAEVTSNLEFVEDGILLVSEIKFYFQRSIKNIQDGEKAPFQMFYWFFGNGFMQGSMKCTKLLSMSSRAFWGSIKCTKLVMDEMYKTG